MTSIQRRKPASQSVSQLHFGRSFDFCPTSGRILRPSGGARQTMTRRGKIITPSRAEAVLVHDGASGSSPVCRRLQGPASEIPTPLFYHILLKGAARLASLASEAGRQAGAEQITRMSCG